MGTLVPPVLMQGRHAPRAQCLEPRVVKALGMPLPSALGVRRVLGTVVTEPPCRAWVGVWEAAGSLHRVRGGALPPSGRRSRQPVGREQGPSEGHSGLQGGGLPRAVCDSPQSHT